MEGTGALPKNGLRTVRVKGLHGKFSYEVDLGTSEPDEIEMAPDLVSVNENRLTLLYGRNGTGKTSLLKLLFHALSPAPNRGHRNALSRTGFDNFEVIFVDGTRVTYSRQEDVPGRILRGEVAIVDQPVVGWEWPKEGQPTIGLSDSGEMVSEWESSFDSSDDPEKNFIAALEALRVRPVFLGDSRAITSDALDEQNRRGRARVEEVMRPARPNLDLEEALSAWRIGDVEDALARARQYLSQLVFAGTQEGSQRVDSIYVNVASVIVSHAFTPGRPKKALLPNLAERVDQIRRRAERFDAYGLLQNFPGQRLRDTLDSAALKNGPLLQQVLEPYLDAFEQRMDALEPGLRAISTFVDAVNSFLDRKRIEFRSGRLGIKIIDEDSGSVLQPSVLSSGEKQIVLLFSDIVALQDETSLFIVDEPEISLNPDWQRKLMPALLSVTEQSAMQLVVATHSIEIMSRYRDRIRELQV